MQGNREKQYNGKDPSRKLELPKGSFHAKMCTIKERNGKDLTEAEDIMKKWQDLQKRS